LIYGESEIAGIFKSRNENGFRNFTTALRKTTTARCWATCSLFHEWIYESAFAICCVMVRICFASKVRIALGSGQYRER